MNEHNVFLIRSDERSANRAIRNCFEAFKGVLPSEAKKITIKLNLCSYKGPESGAVSDPFIVEQLVKCLIDFYGDAELSFVESDTAERSVESLWCIGIDKIAQKYGVKMVNLSKEATIKKKIDGYLFDEIKVPKTIAESDLFISHPKLKTHLMTKMTCGLKNQFGCLPNLHKARFHSRIDEAIADANLAYKPGFTLVDGILGMGGPGPVSGMPKRFNIMIASTDVVAVDCVASKILGFNPQSIGHIKKSFGKKIGNMNYRLTGDKIPDFSNITEFPTLVFYATKLYTLLRR